MEEKQRGTPNKKQARTMSKYENATASGDETFMVEGTLKAAGTDDIATEGRVVVIRDKSRSLAKKSLDGLTEEAKERSVPSISQDGILTHDQCTIVVHATCPKRREPEHRGR